jgi:hypothetical protein
MHSATPPKFSRRSFVAAGAAVSVPGRRLAGPDEPFGAWWAERDATLRRLEVTSEDEPGYEPLMDDLARLERLIFETPSQAPAALRAKSRLLLWLMEQEQHDGLAAMRHIAAYLETLR